MKRLRTLGACALAAAGLASTSFGQIQVAGNLQVSLDAVGQPVGPLSALANSGVAGGLFQSVTNAGTGPQIIALGGSGTHGILFDGNAFLVHQDGSGNPQLAPAALTGTTPTFSVEAWVFAPTLIDDNPVVSWGTRGSCGGQVSCAYGASANWGGLAMWCNDHGWGTGGTPPAGSWHHLAWTLDASGNENLYADGVLKTSYTGVTPNIDPNNNIGIGFSHSSTGGTLDGVTAGLIVGRVRVHDGILTAAQVLNNFQYEAASFTNGTPAFLAAKPMHRWSFSHAATNDAVGLTVTDTGTNTTLANGVIQGTYGGATAQFTGTQLILNGGSSGSAPYVDLPNGLLSTLSTNKGGSGKVTFEIWLSPQGSQPWARAFDFGSNTLGEITAPGGVFSGQNYFGLVATPGNPADLNNSAVGFQSGNLWFKSHATGSLTHMVVTWDDVSGQLTVYENGVEVTSEQVTNRMNDIVDVNNWLGRSNWSGDNNLQGGLAEFRLFNRILSAAEVLNDYQVGPTVVDKVLKWNGNVSGLWDNNTTANWLNGTTQVKYNDGGTVQFDDSLTGTATVSLNFAAQPASLTFNNTLSNYTLTGSGKISGSVGLTKSGTGSLTLGGPGLNDYTGQTVLNNGTLILTNLANGGSPSAIGASSSAAANLTLAGGTLSYRGPAASTDRGYLVTGNTALDAQSDLTINGLVSASGGTFTKLGSATLTYKGAGFNKLSAGGGGQAFGIANGTVVLDGSLGQSNQVTGETWVGFNQGSGASLILTNTSLTNTSWFAIGRGNGSSGFSSSASLYNSTMAVGNVSLGYANGVAGNKQNVALSLNGTSKLINTGGTGFNFGESGGSTSSVSINDSSWIYSANRVLISMANGSTGTLAIANSGALTNGGWVSIGAPGVATATLKNNAIWQALTDFNVTDTAGNATFPSIGTLNIQDNALLRISTLYVGKNTYCTGTINQSGGTVVRSGGGDWRIGGNISGAANQLGIWNFSGGTITCDANFQVGAYGTGYFNQTGGTANFPGGYPDIGRFASGIGYLNVSGGSFNQLGSGNSLFIGEAGTGTLNVSGTGLVTTYNRLGLGWASGGNGTLNLTNGAVYATNGVVLGNNASATAVANLYGGLLATKSISTIAGSGTLNFYGGTLKALPGANATFMSGIPQVTIYNGANIDTDTNVLTLAEDFQDGGMGGGLTKLGTGALTLAGNLYYSGPTVVSAGKLSVSTGMGFASSGCTVADGAELNISVQSPYTQVTLPSVTLGSSKATTLDVDLGTYGNAGLAPLNAFSMLTLNGTITVNISGSGLTIGEFPLLQYGSRAGAGTLVLGTLPAGVVAQLVTNVPNNTIDLNVIAVNQLLWSGLFNNGAWDVNTTGNWTNLLSGLQANYVQGSTVIFDDSAPGTNWVNLTTALTPSVVTFSNSAKPYTLAGAGKLTGAASLNLAGNGTVTLATVSNNYSGTTLVTGGNLIAGVANTLSTNSPVVVSGATLNLLTNSQTAKSLIASNGVIAGTTGTLSAQGFNLENSTVNVTLTGSGALSTSGTNGEVVTVMPNNSYAGATVVGGGTLYATNLANGGLPSSIGASSANPTNLILAGGTLSYQGPATTINRGYQVAGNSALEVAANLTLSGPVTATAGTFAKAGPATLSYTAAGVNQLSAGGGGQAFGVGNGTVVLDGSAGQTNLVTGDVWVGFDQNHGAALVLTNTVLTNSTWLAVGRGNGPAGLLSTLSLYNSTLSCGNVSFGYDNGIAGNSQSVQVTLNGSSKLINRGNFNFSESAGSSSSLTLNDNSVLTSANRILIAMGTGSTGTVMLANSATITNSGWVSVGDPGVATVTLKDNAVWEALTDFNVTDVTGDPASPSLGTVNIQGNALLRINTLYVGKSDNCAGVVNQSGGTLVRGTGGGEWRIGGNASNAVSQVGTYNLSGGTFSSGPNNLQIGVYGQGEWNQTGGTAASGGYVSIGRYSGGVGQMDLSAGTFSQTNAATFLIVGEEGAGTLNLSGGATLNAVGGVSIGHTASGLGTLNLNGGILSVSRIFQGNANSSGTLNFNGGVLQARPGSYPGFVAGLTAANVLAGGAFIDSGANTITVGQALLDGGTGGGLTKLGSGTLVLAGANTYSGATTVTAGTLLVNGSLANGSVDVKSGATLGGNGSLGGTVLVESGATLNPGGGLGTLTVAAAPTLNGSVLAQLDRNGGSPVSSKLVLTSGTLNYHGTLVLANVGAPLAVGDTFTLFNAAAYAGSFTVVSQTPGQTVTWDTSRLAIDGTVKVAALQSATPTPITTTVNGNSLQIAWPADHTGWRLLQQTNHLNLGISLNQADWGTVPGSSSTNQVTLTIDPTKSTEFYRLVYP